MPLTPLGEIVKRPSGWGSLDNYIGETEFDGALCLMTRSRDSDLLTESNWDCALELLGGESENVLIHRFGHWACGWWEALCVLPGTEAETVANEIRADLDAYPVLDDDDYQAREWKQADQNWAECYTDRGRIAYIRERRRDFEFRDFTDLMAQVRGRYFSGGTGEMARP